MFDMDRDEPVIVNRGNGEESVPLYQVKIGDLVQHSDMWWQFALSPQSLASVGDEHPYLRNHRWCVVEHVRDGTLEIPLRPNGPFGRPDKAAAMQVTPNQSVMVLDVKEAPADLCA